MASTCPFRPNYDHRVYSLGRYREIDSLRVPDHTIRIFTETEFQHYLLVESDCDVDTFCEHPNLKIVSNLNGQPIVAYFDMWIRWKDGREEFRRIENNEDKQRFDNNPNEYLSLFSLARWAKSQDVAFEIYTPERIHAKPKLIENWNTIIHFLHDVSWILEQGLNAITFSLVAKKNKITLYEAIDELQDYEETEVIRAMFWNLYYGKTYADLSSTNVSLKTVFRVFANE